MTTGLWHPGKVRLEDRPGLSTLTVMKSDSRRRKAEGPGTAELRRSLEQAGWRFTRQRAAVHDYLQAAHCHPTAEQVYLAVQQQIPNISLATVYKALEALVGAGLASKIAHSEGPAGYDCRSDVHYHYRCLRTGQVCDLPTPFDPSLPDKLDAHIIESLRRQGFHVTGHRLELLGYYTEK